MINNYTDVHVVLNFCLRKEKVVFNQRNKYVVYQTGGLYWENVARRFDKRNEAESI